MHERPPAHASNRSSAPGPPTAPPKPTTCSDLHDANTAACGSAGLPPVRPPTRESPRRTPPGASARRQRAMDRRSLMPLHPSASVRWAIRSSCAKRMRPTRPSPRYRPAQPRACRFRHAAWTTSRPRPPARSRPRAPTAIDKTQYAPPGKPRKGRCACKNRVDWLLAAAQMRRNTSVPLVPPKPKLFFTATSIFMSRAVLAQ
jgi:hypothetical protein